MASPVKALMQINPNKQISVIIPTFNRLWALPRAVAQFYGNPLVGEIIVVDDGSTDGTREWLMKEHLLHPILKPLFHVRNRGACEARNTGITAADCEYIQFWDDDMLLLPAGGLRILLGELKRLNGDVIAPSCMISEGTASPSGLQGSPADTPIVASAAMVNSWTFMIKSGSNSMPTCTFESPLLYGVTLQRKAVFTGLCYAPDLGPTFFRDETDMQFQHHARNRRLLACPFVYAVDLKRPLLLKNDGGCHSQGTFLKYDLIACRNNWRLLRRHKNIIRSKLNIRLPILALQLIFICDRLLYRTARKIVGRILRATKLRK